MTHVVFDCELIGSTAPVFLVCTKELETGATNAFWFHKRGHMEKQEPVAEWTENRFHHYPQLDWAAGYKAVIGAKLYALHGAKGEGEMTPIHDTADLVSKALRRAWQLGQTYWQQADSEYQSHWKKADATQATFDQLVEDTRAAILTSNSGAQLAPSEQDASVRKSWARFSHELHRSPDAPYPGMSEAFEQHFSQSFTDREWRSEASTWAAAWKAAKRHCPQPAPSVPDGWKLVPIEPTTEIRKAMHYAYWQSPQLPYHDGSPELWNAAYAAMLEAAPEAKP